MPSVELSGDVIARLETELVVWLTTVSADGRPQSSPVWFLWRDGTFLIYSQPDAWKVRNLRANPHVSISLRTDEIGSSVVTFEGTAEMPGGPRGDAVPAYVEKYEPLIAGEGWTVEWMTGEYSQPIVVTPTRVRVA